MQIINELKYFAMSGHGGRKRSYQGLLKFMFRTACSCRMSKKPEEPKLHPRSQSDTNRCCDCVDWITLRLWPLPGQFPLETRWKLTVDLRSKKSILYQPLLLICDPCWPLLTIGRNYSVTCFYVLLIYWHVITLKSDTYGVKKDNYGIWSETAFMLRV